MLIAQIKSFPIRFIQAGTLETTSTRRMDRKRGFSKALPARASAAERRIRRVTLLLRPIRTEGKKKKKMQIVLVR